MREEIVSRSVFIFFFFQAEDGIREYKVTGVQTCALPIFTPGFVVTVSTAPGPSVFSATDASLTFAYFARACCALLTASCTIGASTRTLCFALPAESDRKSVV